MTKKTETKAQRHRRLMKRFKELTRARRLVCNMPYFSIRVEVQWEEDVCLFLKKVHYNTIMFTNPLCEQMFNDMFDVKDLASYQRRANEDGTYNYMHDHMIGVIRKSPEFRALTNEIIDFCDKETNEEDWRTFLSC